jgi:hypothetical protein
MDLCAQNRRRRKTDFASAFNPFGRVKKLLENISLFPKPKSGVSSWSSRTRRSKGRTRRHERWAREAMDAVGGVDEGRESGRRKCVVLISRRWDQVGR